MTGVVNFQQGKNLYHLPVAPSTSPLILSPVIHPSARILSAMSLSMASRAAKALLCTCRRAKGLAILLLHGQQTFVSKQALTAAT